MSEGIMHLVDAERSQYLYDLMPVDKRQISGGSAANTAAGVASLGGRASFIGKVAADPLGDIFAEDLHHIGVHYGVSRLHGGPATARSMILISPGGERTMNTYLGACQQLTTADIMEDEDRRRLGDLHGGVSVGPGGGQEGLRAGGALCAQA